MYNFALAFVICAAAFIIGEVVSTVTKAWVPSVFVTAVVMLIGYWTVLPPTLVSDSMLIPFGSTIGIYLLITHMGTVISLKQLQEQWKTIVVCLCGLGGMCALSLLVAPLLMNRNLVIAGLPPLTGGIVAATIMRDAAAAAGLQTAAVFAITMYCIQGFAGYPITAVCLQVEGKRLLKKYRSGEVTMSDADRAAVSKAEAATASAAAKKKLIPPLPAKFDSAVVVLIKLAFVGWIATQMGKIAFPYIGTISGAIWALVLGILFTTIGFLDTNSLNKANSYGIIMFALMMYVFDGLKDCTPEMLGAIIVPMIILIVIGVVGMAVMSFIVAKVLRMSFPMAFANGLTALYGFPCDAIITESTCTALAQTPEEKEYLMSKMFPSMIVGGFVTVTITSVFVAGAFAKMF
ncbi:hypothetical protein [Oscillibacter ruminantium]|jgi:hypothetical protein|uniref:hypothetical protein n=1 Tax=Oscillibacter ruminantium TaxID=1263547 RepID=UPI0002F58FF3|nr:hypothetical protein [Oscillibacter ruminantium]